MERNKKMNITVVLPVECISKIISFTSPKDACRLSVVSRLFESAAKADAVWETFLPSDYKDIIDQSSSPTLNSLPKKQLYLHLCDHPAPLADGNMTLSLDKVSGKKCCIVGAMGLSVIWGQTPRYWDWQSIPESRFSEVAVLDHVWWLDIRGSLATKHLSPNTNYAVYFIFKIPEDEYSFRDRHVGLVVNEGRINESRKSVILDPPGEGVRPREDGWMEAEMGEFVNENGDRWVDFKFWETDCYVKKSGLMIEGVEFRPKSNE